MQRFEELRQFVMQERHPDVRKPCAYCAGVSNMCPRYPACAAGRVSMTSFHDEGLKLAKENSEMKS